MMGPAGASSLSDQMTVQSEDGIGLAGCRFLSLSDLEYGSRASGRT